MPRVIALVVALVALAPGVAWGASWRWPVGGRVVGPFSVSPDDPYAAGQRRGLAIAARPGSPVRSACAGPVAFAGSVGRAGPTLSVACGALRATYQGLSGISVRRGDILLPGQPVGSVSGGGVLRLGARAAPGRYVDPATLLHAAPPEVGPLGRAPRGPIARRRPPLSPPPSPIPAPAGAPAAAARRTAPASHQAPLVAWLGLALLGAAVPVGSLLRRRGPAPTAAFRAWAVRQLR